MQTNEKHIKFVDLTLELYARPFDLAVDHNKIINCKCHVNERLYHKNHQKYDLSVHFFGKTYKLCVTIITSPFINMVKLSNHLPLCIIMICKQA